MPLSEHVYCVAVAFTMTERVEQQICIKFCVKLEYSSVETIWMIPKAKAMVNWWLAVSSWQQACSRITSCAEFLVKHQITQVAQLPPKAQIWRPVTSGFSQNQNHLWKGRDFRPSMRFRKIWWAADGDWENCVRSQGAYSEGAEASLSYVQCFFYLLQ